MSTPYEKYVGLLKSFDFLGRGRFDTMKLLYYGIFIFHSKNHDYAECLTRFQPDVMCPLRLVFIQSFAVGPCHLHTMAASLATVPEM